MANPVFASNGVFNGTSQANGPATYGVPTASAQPASTIDASQLDAMYARPSAGPRETGRMTYDDVVVKTGLLLVIVVAAGALAWTFFPQLYWVGALVALVLGLVNAFRRTPSPALIIGYAAFEGVALGGLSSFMEAVYPGIVLQAVIATLAAFAAVLALYAFRVVRVTGKFVRFVMIAMVGYAIFSLVNLGFMMFGVGNAFDTMISGMPLGLLIGAGAILLAAACLMIDFNSIERAVNANAPEQYAWTAAFGLTVTIVWMYLEILRFIGYLRR